MAENLFDALHTSPEGVRSCLECSWLPDANTFRFFGSSKYSDLIVRCEGRDFQVHKVIVCGQSDFFSSICDGDWKEATEGIVELKEEDVRAIEAMLHFMYTFDYDGSGNDQERASPMIFNAEVYNKYGIPALKTRAKEKFDKAVKTCWDMDDFAHAITQVYISTPSTDRDLRSTIVEVARKNIGSLLEKEGFRRVLEETVGFAADVTQLMAQSKNPPFKKFLCPDCGKNWEASLQPGTNYCLRCGQGRSDWASRAVK